MRFSPRSSFARTLLLIVTLLFVSLVTTYLVVLNFAILPSLQQFNKVLAYEVRMLMTDKLQLEDGTQLVVPRRFAVKSTVSWAFRSIPMKRRKTRACAGRSTTNFSASRWRSSWVAQRKCALRSTKARPSSG
jgi:hypothetical protein